MSAPGVETEAKLVLCGDAPARVADEVARMPAIDPFRLLPARAVTLRDSYLDTPQGALARARLALRVRRCDGDPWLTLKGPDHGGGFRGAVRRSELERPWSPQALRAVLSELRSAGVHVEASALSGGEDPVGALGACGFSVIQDRVTQRRTRDVAEAGGTLVAELAIDCVLHRLGDREVRLHEIEVEALADGATDLLREIVEGLEAAFGPALRRWPHDKLVTGLTLSRIFEAGGSSALVRADGSLGPEGYDEIDLVLGGAAALRR